MGHNRAPLRDSGLSSNSELGLVDISGALISLPVCLPLPNGLGTLGFRDRVRLYSCLSSFDRIVLVLGILSFLVGFVVLRL